MEAPYSKEENEAAWTAWQCLTRTGVNLFLTGKAGSGKTTFLKRLRESHVKNMVVTAPTGVAAINANGVTLHSFFQIPPGTFAPGEMPSSERKINRSKSNVMRCMDLLVIDEVSMVRADLLDLVDARLREQRGNEQPFGGVQLLLIGDLMQLSPVVRPDEAEFLSQYYPNFYFYSSKALRKTQFYTVNLTKIYRQTDSRFIELLNHVRTAEMTADDLETLNSRHIPNFNPGKDSGYIRMTTHVKTAEDINIENLNKLEGKATTYPCKVEDEFPEKSYPTSTHLTLKEGAQVMFIRNGNADGKTFYNGMIVTVAELRDNEVVVQDEMGERITVKYSTWENTKYELNKETGAPEQKVIGTFSQIPLALAWAITIHKSQGLTFDKAIIDASRAFSPGQVYVALSRCRTLDGLVLCSTIPSSAIMTDRDINDFYSKSEASKLTTDAIEAFANEHSMRTMDGLLSFAGMFDLIRRIQMLLERDYGGKYPNCEASLSEILHTDAASISDIAGRFVAKCQAAYYAKGSITADKGLMDQARRGAEYFGERLAELKKKVDEVANITPDDATGRKRISDLRGRLRREFAIRAAELKAVAQDGFASDTVTKARAKAISQANDSEAEPAEAYVASEANEVVNKELFEALRKWRKKKADDIGKPAYVVAPNAALFDIADTVPTTVKELSTARGMGTEKLKLYADELLNIVSSFKKKGVEAARPLPSSPTRKRERKAEAKPDTRQVSFEAFGRLGSAEAVAKERGLTKGTVVKHLMEFVGKGLTTDEIMGAERHRRLTEIVRAMGEDEKPGEEIWREFLGSEYHQVRKELGRE